MTLCALVGAIISIAGRREMDTPLLNLRALKNEILEGECTDPQRPSATDTRK
jgi:hypothetical protein